jgi:hypothetical protein
VRPPQTSAVTRAPRRCLGSAHWVHAQRIEMFIRGGYLSISK